MATETNYPTGVGTQTIPVFDNLPVHQHSFIIGDAAIKALPTTGITAIPALGANKIIIPTFAYFFLNWVADYSNINANCTIGFLYSGDKSSSLLNFLEAAGGQISNLLIDGASHGALMVPTFYILPDGTGYSSLGQYSDEPATINAPLVLKASNGGDGDFGGGDSGNSLQILVSFFILDKSLNKFI